MKTRIGFRGLALLVVLAVGLICAVWNARGCPPLPALVTVTANDPTASEVAPNSGTFRVTRTGGNLNLPLTVYYTLSGKAVNGTDYQTLSGWVQIPAYASTADVTVTPIADGECEGNETVVLTLVPYAYYDVGSPSSATVTIADPPNCDSDGDGLPDWWELQYFGNLAQGAGGDPDADGLTNLEERLLDTNPTTYTSLNGLSSGNGLQVFTPLK